MLASLAAVSERCRPNVKLNSETSSDDYVYFSLSFANQFRFRRDKETMAA